MASPQQVPDWGDAKNEATQRTRLEPLIQCMYACQHKLTITDGMVLFRKTLVDRLDQPFSILTTWLSIAQPAFDAALFLAQDNPMDDNDDDWQAQLEADFPD
jgi:hypothetical protein